MKGLVVLLSDFGVRDPYVGQMKGSIVSIANECRVIDLCHDIEPFNLPQAGFYLLVSRQYFPESAVFVAVVDPGVGGNRRIICLEADGRIFLAPDNGLLSLLLAESANLSAFDLTPAVEGEVASSTFHGRDIFAPLAARLARGEPPEELGTELPVDTLTRLPWTEPSQSEDRLVVHVLHTDRFGNLILNAKNDPWHGRLQAWPSIRMTAPLPLAITPTRSYCELPPRTLGLFRGSQGYLELALNRDSAATLLNVTPGLQIELTPGA